MSNLPKCCVCGAEIVEPLVEVGRANDWVCLDCSGATLEDFVDEKEFKESRPRYSGCSFCGKERENGYCRPCGVSV